MVTHLAFLIRTSLKKLETIKKLIVCARRAPHGRLLQKLKMFFVGLFKGQKYYWIASTGYNIWQFCVANIRVPALLPYFLLQLKSNLQSCYRFINIPQRTYSIMYRHCTESYVSPAPPFILFRLSLYQAFLPEASKSHLTMSSILCKPALSIRFAAVSGVRSRFLWSLSGLPVAPEDPRFR